MLTLTSDLWGFLQLSGACLGGGPQMRLVTLG